ncbi:unnamed protein product [Chondrus crispus]|uniref:Hint domain-containing protein n=1 Tax=Chondrus crispus TaxID=2769 RepID=R7QE10_CHOCR|nr:unnamed protein product [Chondrus crispus]CDF36324.1 unnamed protein product [Chondrus crispus]|eukprot:XP_005716143.1 unnamed protein product [Chondrus crispus]
MARRAAAVLLSLALLPLSLSFPLSAVSRQTTVTSCDDWVSVYNDYWSKFPQCHRGLSTTQCCELYDLMDKSIRIFESSLGCVVTNLQVFAERYAAHCKGGTGMEDTGSSPPTATTPPPAATDTAATTYSGSSGGTEGGHGCGSTGCQTRPTGYCSCCPTCCNYNAARAVHELKPRFLLPASLTLRTGSCINCSNPGGCACDASRCGECNSCQAPSPPPPPAEPKCHQCCSTCCRSGRSTVQLLTKRETLPVSAANVESRCGCGGSGDIHCSTHCSGCARPNACDVCRQGCTNCPVECHSQYSCSSTSGGTCPSCPPSGGSGASTNAGGEQQQAPRDDDDGSVCFGAEAMVQVAGGKRKRMDEVKVGDVVHVGHGVYSEVFLFTHRSDVHVAMFVNLHTKKGTLSATEGHFVHSSRGVVPAETLQVGDLIPTDQGKWERVVEISSELCTETLW